MRLRKGSCLVKDRNPENVVLALQEFEHKYQSYESRWDCEILSHRDNQMVMQLIDKSFETPRGKGQSDCPSFLIHAHALEKDTIISWKYVWKRSRCSISWLAALLLALSRILISLFVSGDKLILYVAIWTFCCALYVALLVQAFLHDRKTMEIFRDLLRMNFENGAGESAAEI